MTFEDFTTQVLAKAPSGQALTVDERLVDDLIGLEFELTQGGLGTYLHNSSSNRIREQIAGLRLIQAHKSAEALEELAERITRHVGGAENWEKRFEAYWELEEELADVDDALSRLIIDHDEPWDLLLQQYYEEYIQPKFAD